LDTVTLQILMSEESTAELDEHLNSTMSMLDSNGNLVYGIESNDPANFAIFAMTYYPLPEA